MGGSGRPPKISITPLTAAARQITLHLQPQARSHLCGAVFRVYAHTGLSVSGGVSTDGDADHRAFASVWQPIRAQRFTAAPHGGWALMLRLSLDVPLPCGPDRCVTTGRTATVRPTGRLPSVTSLASGEAQTAALSGEQVRGDSASPGVGAEQLGGRR